MGRRGGVARICGVDAGYLQGLLMVFSHLLAKHGVYRFGQNLNTTAWRCFRDITVNCIRIGYISAASSTAYPPRAYSVSGNQSEPELGPTTARVFP